MKYFYVLLLTIINTFFSSAQNSLLVNFGATNCGNNPPSFSLIKNPLSGNPEVLNTCALHTQLPDFYNVFIAYNPKDSKIYVADIRSEKTKIWRLDMGLPNTITCPNIINTQPDYEYDYVSNNFEFDNNGNLWSFSEYNQPAGTCKLDQFDVNTGKVLNTRILTFPAGLQPTAITSGDLCILPNGRMFATLGANPSRLYEIENYNASTPATAKFLTQLPQNCYGIAYLNGQLEITGFGENCYYFDYDISTNVLGTAKAFQNGQLPIDNSSITPSLGVTKELISANMVTETAYDLTYDIYVRNMGNVTLNNINVTEDLAKVFGAANISNVTASFLAGYNVANLRINPAFNGSTNTSLLTDNQKLPNNTSSNNDYYFKIRVSLLVRNLSPNKVYYNSAIGTASINNVLQSIVIIDSSNNGNLAMIDPNNNGNPNEVGENIPTPFSIYSMPVTFLSFDGTVLSDKRHRLKWTVATPTENAKEFIVQYSTNGSSWQYLNRIAVDDPQRGVFEYSYLPDSDGPRLYRLKQVDMDGAFIYSNTILLQSKGNYLIGIYPNPVKDVLYINSGSEESVTVRLLNMNGQLLQTKSIVSGSNFINTQSLANGLYLLKIQTKDNSRVFKFVKQ